MVYFGYDKDDFKSDGSSYKTGITFTTGIARTGVLCAPHPGNKKDKFSINEWNPKGTAAMGAVSNFNVKLFVEFFSINLK